MRIASIELDGTIEKGHTLPRAFARISRKRGSDHIEVVILQPDRPETTRRILASDFDALLEMAKHLFETLEGRQRCTKREYRDYHSELPAFAD